MKNSEQPAFAFVDENGGSYEDRQVFFGLTKREYFALSLMNGILAGRDPSGADPSVKWAVTLADELLKELDK